MVPTDVDKAAGTHEAAGVCVVALVVIPQHLHDSHVFQDTECWGAHGVSAVLVPREVLLVQDDCLRTETWTTQIWLFGAHLGIFNAAQSLSC